MNFLAFGGDASEMLREQMNLHLADIKFMNCPHKKKKEEKTKLKKK